MKMNTVGERILYLIDYYKTNRGVLSRKIGVNPSVLHNICNGNNYPSYEVIKKLLEEFTEISADWLITGNGEMLKTKNENSVIFSDDSSKIYYEEQSKKIAMLEKAFDAQEVTIKTLVEMNAYLKELLGNKKQ